MHFFGNVYIPQSVIPDPKKAEAIKKDADTRSKQELQSFLGMGIMGISCVVIV